MTVQPISPLYIAAVQALHVDGAGGYDLRQYISRWLRSA